MCVEANHPRMRMVEGDIKADSETIGPSDILRINPWGNSEYRPTANASMISINNSIRERLAHGDVRKNYFMVGATWGPGGTDCGKNAAKESNCLANSTMETFQQPSHCTFCHNGDGPPKDMLGGVSHVYTPLSPLDLPNP
jgi:hypothetical protein